MNFNNFTIKSQEAVQEAVNLTQTRGQQAIEPVHLLAGVLKVGENVTNFIFQKLGMNAQQVTLVIDKQIDSLPKVSGGEPYLSRESNEVLQRATQYSKEMGDEYVSLEAIILALLNVKSKRCSSSPRRNWRICTRTRPPRSARTKFCASTTRSFSCRSAAS